MLEGRMKHFIKNLLFLPFRLAWDIFLVLISILFAAVIYGWVCATGIGVFVLIGLFLTDPLTALLPFGLLVFLRNPWPKL